MTYPSWIEMQRRCNQRIQDLLCKIEMCFERASKPAYQQIVEACQRLQAHYPAQASVVLANLYLDLSREIDTELVRNFYSHLATVGSEAKP